MSELAQIETSIIPLDMASTEKVVAENGVHTMSTTQYRSLLGVAFGAVALGCTVGATPSLAAEGRAAAPLCYLWADNPSPPLNTPYQPSPTYSFNAVNGPDGNSVSKFATGSYFVTCTGVGGGPFLGPGGHVQVSAYGDGVNTFCHVGSWSTGLKDFTATVDCFGRGGGTGGGPAPADSRFDLLFVW
jgi:hypothetical protein